MHFLLTALGSYGDVHPMIGLGSALAGRGHEVELLANPYFEQEVHGAGLGFIPMGTAEEYLELTRHPDLWRPRQSLPMIVRQASLKYLAPMHRTVAERCRPGETVIAAHGLDLASRVVRDQGLAPVASVTFAPLAVWSSTAPPKLPVALARPWLPRWVNATQFAIGERLGLRPLIAPELNKLRRELGLPPAGRLMPDWWYAGACNVCLFPEWFAAPQPDWPSGSACVGFPQWDGGQQRPLSDACQAFLDAGEPPIAFTPGTANRQGERFFADAVDACVRLGRRGVLLTKFAEQLPADLPDVVRRFEFEPLSQLLPRCAAFVHHGGIGSSSQGLAAGVPQLIRPLAFDQHDNAERLRRLGVAEELSPRRFAGQSAAEALGRLIGSAAVGASCRRYAEQCDGRAARDRACDLLEGLLAADADRPPTIKPVVSSGP
ncbi:MurG-like transferase [Posidoniimonas polymericola]|uniref:MurG-like transferase n=1 Tax=Posidoniimonas polymericola TaxID=2528002 RepID=A0A5C5YMK9_9BACT|nr:nucleotide disphospho-sugar-binding domain-containing protein [Posidoniimonas polymericola]TWT76079.1 MurG-like transferase [Posidoniimonas polymericola]